MRVLYYICDQICENPANDLNKVEASKVDAVITVVGNQIFL